MNRYSYQSFAILFCLVSFSLFGADQQHQIVRRAALDIGSGKIKIQVSDVDVTANKLINVLLTDTAVVRLREDLVNSLDGRLSPEIQNKTVDAIVRLMEKASHFRPEAYHAIATESLRLAKNADALAKRIKKETGLSVTVVTQEEEGILGFISAVNEADVDLDQAVSWDAGGGSFQIAAKCGERYLVYQGKLGQVPIKNVLLNIQGKDPQTFSPNPISNSDAEQALRFIKDQIEVPSELREKLHRPDAVVLGVGIHPLWVIDQNPVYDKGRVWKELNQRLNLDDDAIRVKDSIDARPKEAYVVSNLLLAYGIMDALGMHSVRYVGTPGGNAIGALLSPQYWTQD